MEVIVSEMETVMKSPVKLLLVSRSCLTLPTLVLRSVCPHSIPPRRVAIELRRSE